MTIYFQDSFVRKIKNNPKSHINQGTFLNHFQFPLSEKISIPIIDSTSPNHDFPDHPQMIQINKLISHSLTRSTTDSHILYLLASKEPSIVFLSQFT